MRGQQRAALGLWVPGMVARLGASGSLAGRRGYPVGSCREKKGVGGARGKGRPPRLIQRGLLDWLGRADPRVER